MDLLYDAAAAWKRLLDYRYEIIWGKKGIQHSISLDFQACEFYHLAGFPHIKDITFPVRFSQSKMMDKVLSRVITQEMIMRSESFERTVRRKLVAVIRLEQMLNGCPRIYQFNPRKLNFHTKITANYLLADDQNGVLFLFADKDKQGNRIYSKSAFMMDTQDFRINQTEMKLLLFRRIDLPTGENHILYCKPGFVPEPAAV